MLTTNGLEALTADVIEAAANILVIGNWHHRAITERREVAIMSTPSVLLTVCQ